MEDKKVLFVILLTFMLVVPLVSAGDYGFDNFKIVNGTTIEVWDTGFLGLFPDKKLAEFTLDTPHKLYVNEGYQNVANFTINNIYEERNDIIEDLEFFNVKRNDGLIPKDAPEYDYKYYVKVGEREFYDYGDCQFEEEECKVVDTFYRDIYETREFDNTVELPKLEIKILIYTTVKKGDRVEWIPSFMGIRVEEWAEYENAVTDAHGQALESGDASTSSAGVVIKINHNKTLVSVNTDTNGFYDYCWVGNTTHCGGVTDGVKVIPLANASVDATTGYANFTIGSVNFEIGTCYVITCGNLTGQPYTRRYNALSMNVNKTNIDYHYRAYQSINKSWWGYAGSRDHVFNIISITTADLIPTTEPDINLSIPANATSQNTVAVTFNCSATDESIVENLTLWIDNAVNYTVFDGLDENLSLQKSLNVAEGDYTWTCSATDDDNDIGWAESNRTLTIDLTDPSISYVWNLTAIVTDLLPINSTWNYTVSDAHLGDCYYNTSDNATLTFVVCNVSEIKTQWETGGVKTVYPYVNDTANNEVMNVSIFNLNFIGIDYYHNPDSIGEGGSIYFELYVNRTNIETTSAYLFFNDTIYNPDTVTAYTDYYYFDYTFTVPDGYGNSTGIEYDYYWNFTIDTVTDNRSTTTDNFTVYSMEIGINCTAYGKVILNMTLFDEETNTLINRTAGSNVEVDIDITSLDESKVWNYSYHWIDNSTGGATDSMAVCVPDGVLNSTNYTIDFTVGFDATDYVREFYYMANGSLNNAGDFNSYTTYKLSLMDLLSADSTTFLFEYTDKDNQEVDDIIIHTNRKYIGEGLFREVERSKQDNAGQTHVHLVEEDVIYSFMVTQYGIILFTSDTYNAKCLSTPCTISLSASVDETNWSIVDNEGGQYAVSSNQETRIVTVAFSLDESELVNATIYQFVDGEAEVINATSLTAMSGSMNIHVPLAYDNSTFFIAIYNENEFVKSQWIDMTESGISYFGTFGAILGAFIVLALMLMAVAEGVGFIVITILALLIITIMQLVDLSWLALVSIICAGAIIVWKLTTRRHRK